MQGRALTPDVILSGNLSVSKTVNLQNKIIYHNGQYEADDGYDGLGKVTVDVHNEMTDLKATENGVYLPPEGYDGFDRVDVDVPDPELDTIHITQNGRYTPPAGVVGYDDIHVNVNLNLESKTITANGHYEPSQGKNGFSEVTVNVPERVPVIESKSITENGTYTAPTGVDGYSPITVNVPLPANAYLLKELSNLPQPIASFSDGSDNPLKSLTVSIEPVQAGSGDPSPENVRPISGWSGVNVYNDGANLFNQEYPNIDSTTRKLILNVGDGLFRMTTTTPLFTSSGGGTVASNLFLQTGEGEATASTQDDGVWLGHDKVVASTNGKVCIKYRIFNNITAYNPENFETELTKHTTTTIPFTDSQGNPVEVYGGSVDVVNGGENPSILKKIDLGSLSWVYVASLNGFRASKTDYKKFSSAVPNGCCEIYKMVSNSNFLTNNPNNAISFGVVGGYDNNILIRDTRYTDATEFKTAVTGKYLCYELATPTTFYTQPTSIKSLDGVNNVFASTGDVTECEYFTPVQ